MMAELANLSEGIINSGVLSFFETPGFPGAV